MAMPMPGQQPPQGPQGPRKNPNSTPDPSELLSAGMSNLKMFQQIAHSMPQAIDPKELQPLDQGLAMIDGFIKDVLSQPAGKPKPQGPMPKEAPQPEVAMGAKARPSMGGL